VRAFALFFAILLAACGTRGDPEEDTGTPVFDARPGDECAVDLDCNDTIACTIDHCEMGACTHDACTDCCPEGLSCEPAFGCRTAPEPCNEDVECADGVPCTIDRCRDGEFCEHLPQAELCESGETCLPALGCIPEPPDTCETGEDCTRGNECYGTWSCQPEFGCQFLAPPDCGDDDDCTDDLCDVEAGMCSYAARDADRDGYGDAMCGADDCDDSVGSVYPGADEVCNGRDDDCDAAVDESCCTAGEPCATSCGTMGTTTCNPDGTAGICEPPAEVCNGIDDDCDGAPDNGFMCRAGESEVCTTGCSSMGMRTCDTSCSWEACVAPAESCNGADDDCNGTVDDGFACVLGSSSSCATACGSTGTRDCLGDCSLDSCVPPAEVCNGVDDDCDAAPDDGFDCVRGTTASCMTSCGSTGSRTCRNSCTYGACAPPAEGCTGVDDDCDGRIDEASECTAGMMRSCTTSCGSTGAETCGGGCTYGSCVPPTEVCNGVDDDCDGACDDGVGMCCAGSSVDCTSLGMGFASGTATCQSDCSGYDTSTCSLCGNGVINGSEACDDPDYGGATCSSVGAGTGGTLACTSLCTHDTSMCRMFNPNGDYGTSPPPTQMCAFFVILYLVDYNITTFTFVVSGTSITVSGAPCVMTGSYDPATRSFDATCTLTGTCDETYSLMGMFTSDDEWMGTFSSDFTPMSIGDCYDCLDQTHPVVTGTRL